MHSSTTPLYQQKTQQQQQTAQQQQYYGSRPSGGTACYPSVTYKSNHMFYHHAAPQSNSPNCGSQYPGAGGQASPNMVGARMPQYFDGYGEQRFDYQGGYTGQGSQYPQGYTGYGSDDLSGDQQYYDRHEYSSLVHKQQPQSQYQCYESQYHSSSDAATHFNGFADAHPQSGGVGAGSGGGAAAGAQPNGTANAAAGDMNFNMYYNNGSTGSMSACSTPGTPQSQCYQEGLANEWSNGGNQAQFGTAEYYQLG